MWGEKTKATLVALTMICLVSGFYFINSISGVNGKEMPSFDDSLVKPDEVPSPSDRIKPSQIHIYPNRITIDIEGAFISGFADTNSMDPVLDIEANALQIIPKSENEIRIGDIISYETPLAASRVIHRVVEIGSDEDGWYAIAKGDNLAMEDPSKIRFSQIKRVVIAVLY